MIICPECGHKIMSKEEITEMRLINNVMSKYVSENGEEIILNSNAPSVMIKGVKFDRVIPEGEETVLGERPKDKVVVNPKTIVVPDKITAPTMSQPRTTLDA